MDRWRDGGPRRGQRARRGHAGDHRGLDPTARPLRALDVLRFEVDLDQLRDAWPRVRADLRCYVLGYVREYTPEDLEALERGLQACGIQPPPEAEPNAAGSALRPLLLELLSTRDTERARFELRTAFMAAHARGVTPRLGRYLLARALSERRPIVAGRGESTRAAEARALLEHPHPDDRPTLPSSLVAPALILLATLDVLEARAGGNRSSRGRSAFNVLRNVSPQTRWSADQRAVMESVLAGSVRSDEDLLALAMLAIAGEAELVRKRRGRSPSESSHHAVIRKVLLRSPGEPMYYDEIAEESADLMPNKQPLTVMQITKALGRVEGVDRGDDAGRPWARLSPAP